MTTYHVATTGNDDNPGSEASPFATIAQGLSVAQPGDTVYLHAGTYYESAAFPRSGTATAPITVRGEIDRSGNRLATINPSQPLTGTWVEDASIGPDVWSIDNPGYVPYYMSIDGEMGFRISNTWLTMMAPDPDWFNNWQFQGICAFNTGTDDTKVYDYLGDQSGCLVEVYGTGNYCSLWTLMQSMWGSTYSSDDGSPYPAPWTASKTYIRFKDGDDPNDKTFRTTPWGKDVGGAGVRIYGVDYCVVEAVNIEHGCYGVYIGGNATHNTVRNCSLKHGWARVHVMDGHYNTIEDNVGALAYADFTDFGAWGMGSLPKPYPQKYLDRAGTYMYWKFLMGGHSTADTGIYIERGNGNVIRRNYVGQGGIGIMCGADGPDADCYDCEVHDNVIEDFTSVGFGQATRTSGACYNNTIRNCNANFRIHSGYLATDNSQWYFYHNKSYLPHLISEHIFYYRPSNYDANRTAGALPLDAWWYHNSFCGGRSWLSGTGDKGPAHNGYFYLDGDPPTLKEEWHGSDYPYYTTDDTKFVNNIISTFIVVDQHYETVRDPDLFKAFDYNWCGWCYYWGWPQAYMGPHCVVLPGTDAGYTHRLEGVLELTHGPGVESNVFWDDSSEPDWMVPADSPARGTALDLSVPFVLDGVLYDPLPGLPYADMGAVPVVPSLSVGPAVAQRAVASAAPPSVSFNRTEAPMLTATVDQYLGRSVDLLLYDGMRATGDTLLTPALARPGQSGAEIAGIQKLAQRFLLELLTPAGSLQYLPARGCGFMDEARQGGWRTEADVEQAFYASLLGIRRNLVGEESANDPYDERFSDARLLSVSVTIDQVTLTIQVTSLAGTSRTVLFPLRVNKL